MQFVLSISRKRTSPSLFQQFYKYSAYRCKFLLTNVGVHSILVLIVNIRQIWRKNTRREPGESISQINKQVPLKSSSIFFIETTDYSISDVE